MHKLLKFVGWVLIIPAIVLLLLVPYAIGDKPGAVVGLLFMAGLSGLPGGLLLYAGISRKRTQDLEAHMVGFVRSRDAFTLAELAAHIGRAPGETELLLSRDIARYQLPLVLHRTSGRYLRLDRLAQTAQVAEHCQSCGGALGNQVVFEAEHLTCPYCNVRVVTHAPAQANWQQAQGAWAQPQPYGQQQHAHHQQQHAQQHAQQHQQHAQQHQQHAQQHQQHAQQHQQHAQQHRAPNPPPGSWGAQ